MNGLRILEFSAVTSSEELCEKKNYSESDPEQEEGDPEIRGSGLD